MSFDWISFIANTLKRSASLIEKKIINRRFPPEVKIHTTSQLALNRLRLRDNCSIRIGKLSQIDGSVIFDKDNASINIGDRVFMNGTLISAQQIDIGDDVLISWGVTVVDHNAHSLYFSERSNDLVQWRTGKKDWSNVNISPIKISNRVWIGFNSIILAGITIGEGAVIGAGSVVTKDIPSWTLAAGNPARIIKNISENKKI